MIVSRIHLLAAISLAVALASLGALGVVLLQQRSPAAFPPTASASGAGSASVTAPADPDAVVKAMVATEYAKLKVPPVKIERVADRAVRLRTAIKQRDYAAASQIASRALAESRISAWRFEPFTTIADDFVDLIDPDFARCLDAWVAAQPQDALPLVLRAEYHFRLGWFVRGDAPLAQAGGDHMRSFGREMDQALDDIEGAIKIDQGNPYSYALRLSILNGDGMSKRMLDAFHEASERYPDYYGLYSRLLGALQPKWGGTTEYMRSFVDYYAGPAPANSPLKLLYVVLYSDYLSIAEDDCWQAADQAQCVAADMRKLVKPDLEMHVKEAFQLYDLLDPSAAGHFAFGIAVEPSMRQMMEIRSGDFYAGAMLQLLATAMHSDTQLKQEKPGRNDYMIDKLLALSWFQKGFYDNALTKADDALQDTAATNFAGEADRNKALAGIYLRMSESYANLMQLPASIAASQAGNALSGINTEDHLACYGYYMLKAYATAIDECTAVLTIDPNSMVTRFWRARAYDELGRKDAALADYALVAGSSNGFRSDAATDMAMIYFNRKDNQAALDLLNSYDYLFDARFSSETTMAVAYNNRCYAYMELGQLQKALADCRQSLKHGNLPEAFRKEQELVQRLGLPKADL